MNSSEFFKALFAEHDLVGGVFVGNVQVLQHVAPELLTDLVYDTSNRDVYFHTTTHDPAKIGSRGKNASSVEITSLWCDLDLNHKDADYADENTALELIRQTEPNIIVATGGGYHLYWLLDAPIQSGDYKTVVKDWQVHCGKLMSDFAGRNVKLDQTGDLARVLRVPDTLNTKHQLVVQAGWNPNVGQTRKPINHFTKILREAGLRTSSPNVRRDSNASLGQQLSANLGAIEIVQEPPQLDSIIANCQQVRQIAELQGNVYEPLWYTALGLASYVDNPTEAAHRLSAGHPEYVPQDTIEKMNQWREATDGPPTCAKFMQENPAGCTGCPFNRFERGQGVTSPLQLGRMGETATQTEPTPVPTQVAAQLGTMQQAEQPQDGELPESAPLTGHFMSGMTLEEGVKFARQFVVAPCTITNNGAVVLSTLSDEGEEERNVIMPNGLLPVRYQQQLDGDASSNQYVFAHWDSWATQWRLLHVPGEVFAAPATVASHISSAVQHLTTPARLHLYMNSCALQLGATQKPEQLVMSYGWVNSIANKPARFALGNTMYYPSGDTSTTSLKDQAAARDFGLNPVGELQSWSRAASLLLARPQMKWHRFAFLAAIGAPLIKFSPVEGGMISLYSSESGTYKSFTTRLINSVYSRGDKVTIVQKNATMNAQNAVLSTFNGLPTTFDEISEIAPEEIRTLAYSVSDGRLRERLTQTGERQANKAWSTIMVCTTNRMLFDKIADNRVEAGAEAARLVELDVNCAQGAIGIQEVQVIDQLLNENSGVAGPLIAAYITKHQEKLTKIYSDLYLKMMSELGGSSEWRFWVSMSACAVLGASIARSTGVLGSDVTDGIEALCHEAIREQIDQHEQAKVGIEEIVQEFLAENVGRAVVVNAERHPINRNQPRDIWYSTPSAAQNGKCQVIIWKKQLTDYVVRQGYNKAALAKELRSAGLLNGEPKHWDYPHNLYLRGATGGIDWPAPTRPKCVILTLSASAVAGLADSITNEEAINET